MTNMNELTADQYREMARDARRRSAESWDRSGTDGYLSQWASDSVAREYDLAADLAEAGWVAEFPALFDLEGNLVAAKLVEVENRYGPGKVSKWIVLENDDPRSRAMQWITAFPTRKSTMTRKGYTEGYVKAPAQVGRSASGYHVAYFPERTDGGFSRDVEIVTTCREYKA
jgi:hypothetical protein